MAKMNEVTTNEYHVPEGATCLVLRTDGGVEVMMPRGPETAGNPSDIECVALFMAHQLMVEGAVEMYAERYRVQFMGMRPLTLN